MTLAVFVLDLRGAGTVYSLPARGNSGLSLRPAVTFAAAAKKKKLYSVSKHMQPLDPAPPAPPHSRAALGPMRSRHWASMRNAGHISTS